MKSAHVTAERQDLLAAIEGLYDAFGRYSLAEQVSGCPHCTSSEDDRTLRSQPLRRLPVQSLERFAFKAMTTLGSLADFKHFLPRLFELAAEGAFEDLDQPVLFGKLQYGKWTQWPAMEQAAVRTYLMALWNDVLASESPSRFSPSQRTADEMLCCIGCAVDVLQPFLTAWERRTDLIAARHLVAFVEVNYPDLQKRRQLGNAFWSSHEQAMGQATAWLLHPSRIEMLQSAFFALGPSEPDASLAVELSYTISMLEAIGAS